MKKFYQIFMNKVMPMRTAFVAMFMLLVLGAANVSAQTNITIGTGTDYYYAPLPGWYGWQYEVYLYDASDINREGYITKIAYNIYSAYSNTSTSSFQIYMKDVDASYTLSTSTTFATYISGASLVYSNSSYSTPSTGWNTLTLSSQFCHDASKSLLVAVKSIGCGTSGGCFKQCYYTSASNKHWYKRQDSSDPGATATGTLDDKRANIILTFNGSCSITDPCDNVTRMTCGTTYSGTLGTSGAWTSYTDCVYSEDGAERVYSFTPTTSGAYTFTGTATSGDPDFYIMSSCGNTGTNLAGGCWDSGSKTVTLSAGTTYYLIVDNWSNSSSCAYTLSVDCPQINPCDNITVMTCGATYSGTLGTSGAWSSYTSCSWAEPGEERVYSFTPTQTGSYTFSATETSNDPDFFLMSSCGNTGTNILGGCWDSGQETVTLTAGTTYYLIVDNNESSTNSSYTVSISCPSGPCATATTMTCGTTYSGTLGTSGIWDSYTSSTWSEPGEERVYRFTPSTTGSYTFATTTTSGDPDFFLMASCGNTGTNIVGSNWGSGNQTVSLTAGTTYYLIVDNYSSSSSAGYTVSVTCPSNNGPCGSATTMACGQTYSGTLGTSGVWNSYSSCGYSEPGEEHVYAFTPITTGSHTFITSTTSGDPDFFLMSSCGTSGTNLVGTCWGIGNQTVTLTAGTTYYLIVDNYSSSNSAGYTVSVSCPNGSDITGSSDCESAQAFCATNESTGYDMNVERNSPAISHLDGMCTFFNNPTWWYLRVSQSGPIQMTISSCGDVDFGCWGPFDNPTCDITNDLSTPAGLSYAYYSGPSNASYWGSSYNGTTPTPSTTTSSPICSTFALAEPVGNLIDFGGSTSAVEYLQIPNAEAGKFYILLVANFANCSGDMSIVQTNINDPNAGRSDCTIVNDCNITSITTIVGNCAADQTFTVSGNINFTDPPTDGTLTISDGAVSQVFTPPFVSPISYSLTGVQGDGGQHTIMASFVSSTTNCEKLTYFDAPMCEINCPDATVAMTGYSEVIGDRYYFDVCLGDGVNMYGTQTGYTSPSWSWSINPHGGEPPYVISGTYAPYIPLVEQGYDVSLTVTEGECSTVAYGRIRVSAGLETSLANYALGEICVGDSREITIGGAGSDIQVDSESHTIEATLGHAATTFIPDGTNCATQCYTSDVTFYDFDDGAVVTNTDAIKYIKINTEHSFFGDVQIKITCPERNGVRRSAIILPDYFSSDYNSGIYNSYAIDPYTYVWPDVETVTRWRVGTTTTNWYTGPFMHGREEVFESQNEAYEYNGQTYYLLSFGSPEDAADFINNYLSRYYTGTTYVIYDITQGASGPYLYSVIGYRVSDGTGDHVYIVWMSRDNTTAGNNFSFPTQEAAQYFLTNVCGGEGVISSYESNNSYSRVFFGEPDLYDVTTTGLSSSQICDGTDEHNLPGIGYDYAWTSNSQYTTVGYVYDLANLETPSASYNNGTAVSINTYHVLPSNVEAGTQMYQPFQSFSSLIGCPLNGTWSISVCDSWGKDNGYVFEWELALSEDLLPSNWDYTVELDGVSNDCGSIATVSGNNLIIAPQTATNGEQSCNIVLSDNLGCTTNIPLSYTAVAPTITHISGSEDQTVCEDQPITDIVYRLGGSAVSATATGLPAGVSLSISGNTVTVTGFPSEHNTYNYTITTISATGLHCTEATVTGRIIVNEGNIVPTFAQAGPYCEGTTVADLPTTSTNGITGQWSPNITNSTNTYTFTPDAGQCATITTMLITVNPQPTLEYTSGSETFCQGVAMDGSILFTYGGSVNGATVSGLPAGWEYNNYGENMIEIHGPTNVEARTYNYTVTTTGAVSPCENISVSRTITIREQASIELTSGTSPQRVCNGADITDFVFTYTGATGAVASGLPAGLNAPVLNTTDNTLTISGRSTAPGTFTVTTTGAISPCPEVSTTATIIINDPAELDLISESPDVALCVEVPWEDNIQYQFGGAATGATVTGLPEGITYSVSGNTVTISGTPSISVEADDYTYTVTTTGVEEPCENKSLTGVISISTNAVIVLSSANGTDNQSICLPDDHFTNIVYTYSGGATGIDEDMLADALPDGLGFTVNTTAHTVTIYATGAPMQTGVFHYTVLTTGIIPPCKPDEKYGTIKISDGVELEVTGNTTQNLCLGNAMSDIVFIYGGGATGVTIGEGSLPAGVEQITDATNHTLTLTGTPTAPGQFDFSISTIGATAPCSNTDIAVSITVYEAPEVSINYSDDEICNGSSVNLSSNPATFNSYRWTCTTESDATHNITAGMPASTTTSSISVSPTVTPGSADVVYVLRVSNGNNCTATVSQIINVSEIPTADIVKTDNTKCMEPYNGTITVSNFAGGVAGSTYSVSVTGQATQTTTGGAVTFSNLEEGSYTVRITNETTSTDCYTEQTIVISNTPTNPSVSISGSQSICSGNNTTLTAHPSNGLEPYSYHWSNNSTNEVLETPNLFEQTSYSLTVTDANSCFVTTSVTISIGDNPEISVTANNACIGDDVVLQASVSNAGTGYSVTWSASPSAGAGLSTTSGERITVTPTSPRDHYTYTATLSANSCNEGGGFTDYNDDVSVVVYSLPTVDIQYTDNTITCTNEEVTVTATQVSGYSYSWSNSVTEAENTFTAPGTYTAVTTQTYTVTVTDEHGCTATDDFVLTIDKVSPDARIDAVPGTELSCEVNAIQLTALTTTDGTDLSWTAPTATDDNPLTVTSPGIYQITALTTANGCTRTASVEITSDDNTPTVSIATPSTTTLNCTTTSITLNATGTGALTWSPANVATIDNYSSATDGNYIVTATIGSCTTTASIHINKDVEPLDVNITPVNPLLTCGNDHRIELTAVADREATYAWYQGPHEANYTVHDATTYTVTATAIDNGCSTVETITVGLDDDAPDVNITPTVGTITCDANSQSFELEATSTTPDVILSWQSSVWGDNPPASQASPSIVTVTTDGTYIVKATASNGCTSTASSVIGRDENMPQVSISAPRDVLMCNSDGDPFDEITLSASANVAVTYEWNNETGTSPGSGQQYTVTEQGIYFVTATSTTNGCEAFAQFEISQDVTPPQIAIRNNSNTNVLTCSGPSISVSIVDDTEADIYQWSGGENSAGTGNVFTVPNTYYVTATAPNGCTSIADITILENRDSPSVSIINNTIPEIEILTCEVDTIFVTGVGVMPVGSSSQVVSYSWSGGTYTDQASNALTTIGIYVVTATADNGCTGTSQIEIMATMDRPQVRIDAPNTVINCNNEEDGLTLTAVATDGGVYTYSWSGGMYPDDAVNQVFDPVVYTVVATAPNGCTAAVSQAITENRAVPIFNVRSESGFYEVNCNGPVHAIAEGGVGISYLWPDGYVGTENNLTSEGRYSIIATGTNGCTSAVSIDVTEDLTPAQAVVRSSYPQIDCNHRTVDLTVDVVGGATYYEWSQAGEHTQTISVQHGGIYWVTVKGRNGCPNEIPFDLPEDLTLPTPSIDNITGTPTLNCRLDSIHIIAHGGYSFAWSNAVFGGGPEQYVTLPGVYRVTVTGANGCSDTTSITIYSDREPPTLYPFETPDGTELNCSVDRVTVISVGNAQSYTWSGGIALNSNTQVFTMPGDYYVTATGFNGCITTETINIEDNHTRPQVTIDNGLGEITTLDCNNDTIPITVIVTGSDGPYEYLWSNNYDGEAGDHGDLTAAGQYIVTVTAANTCWATADITLRQDFVAPVVNVTSTPGNELNCNVRSINLFATEGYGSYLWSNGATTSTTTVRTEDVYSVVVTGDNGCTGSNSIQIHQVPEFAPQVMSDTILCYGGSTMASVVATGGTPPYEYAWSDGQSGITAYNLVAGVAYSVSVSDMGGCSAVLPFAVVQRPELNPIINVRDINCGISQGALTAVVTGGTLPYQSYVWSNGEVGTTIENLSAGTYRLTVFDANGCTADAEAHVSMLGLLSVSASVTQSITCFGYNDGSVSAVCQNAAQPPVYSWNTGLSSPELYNLFAGVYTVSVTDAWGCTGQAAVNLVSPPEMDIQVYSESPTCYNSKDGSIIVSAFGGMAPYDYFWNNSTSENEISGVGTGTYSVSIIDAAGCSVAKTITLEAPPAINVETTVSEIKCNGEKTGRIEVSAEGGVLPYRYMIEGLIDQTSMSVFNNLNAGYYVLHVIDNNNCDVREPVLVPQPDELQVSVSVEDPFCRNSRTGKINVGVVGGVEPYLYSLNNSTSDVSYLQNIPSGDYTVTVIDGNNCRSSEMLVTLTDVDVACLRIPNVFTPNDDGVNDIWEIVNIEMFPAAEVNVFNRWGQLLFTSKGYTEPWDGRYRGHFVPAGTYLYVIDLFNDDEPYKGVVTIIY